MPIYEFLCPECNRLFSFMVVSMSDDRTPACPRCGGDRMTKQLSLFAFVRGGTDPFAAIPPTDDDEGNGERPERDEGLYWLR